MYASVNSTVIPILEIADRNSTPTSDQTPPEDIEDPKWELPEHQLAYPPNPKFLFSYNCYLQHVACTWTVNENDPLEDYDKFSRAPVEFQRVILRTAACIMIGDSVVLDKLSMHVTPRAVKVMLTNQEDRENTHQIMYSKWCDITSNGEQYRSLEFRKSYMGEFEELARRYEDGSGDNDIRITLYFIMLCENIMFAPFFAILNYLATTGFANKICNANLMVMRDEYIHYVHARGLLASFRRKIPFELARRILDEFVDVTLNVTKRVVEDYDDGFFNYRHVHDHFRHIVHGFMVENGLYRDANEASEGGRLWGVTPAESYMSLAKAEIKINLMENVSTIYRLEGVSTDIDMSF
ncbi:hypothetical protein ANTRET_LOCUS10823 [Anthophora retusa]